MRRTDKSGYQLSAVSHRPVLLILGLSIGLVAGAARADVLFESGTLGPTGVTWTDLTNGNVMGSNISRNVFNGTRFYLARPAVTTRIGGHFAAQAPGNFFGAIVKLTGEDDIPDSGDLATPDVLGHTLLTFPTPSAEVFGNMNLNLDPGWYAVVFGSGLFGTLAAGGTVQNGNDIGTPSYLSYETGVGWTTPINPIFRNYRFVVEGNVVAEPSTLGLEGAVLPLLLLALVRKRV
jgi:hypothetical protein